MKLIQKIWKTGGSLVITIPKDIIELYQLREKDKLEIEIELENIHYLVENNEKAKYVIKNRIYEDSLEEE